MMLFIFCLVLFHHNAKFTPKLDGNPVKISKKFKPMKSCQKSYFIVEICYFWDLSTLRAQNSSFFTIHQKLQLRPNIFTLFRHFQVQKMVE